MVKMSRKEKIKRSLSIIFSKRFLFAAAFLVAFYSIVCYLLLLLMSLGR